MNLVMQIALRPSRSHRRVLARSAWARRLAFNAALAWHLEERKAERPAPSEYQTAAWLRAWRKKTAIEKPDLALVAARVFEYAAEDLERAWKAAHDRGAGRPRFEKFDSLSGGFGTDGAVRVEAGRVVLPRIGAIRIAHGHRERPDEKPYSYARVTRRHGEWFASLPIQVEEAPAVEGLPVVGLDMGARKLAVLSDGMRYENPRALEQVARQAQRALLAVQRRQRAADKKMGVRKKGERRQESRRLHLARRQLGRILGRAADIRRDAIHQATTRIARQYSILGVEDLRVKKMTARRHGRGRSAKAALNRRILDAAPATFLRVLDYKVRLRGGHLVQVDPAYTSQTCSLCGNRHDPGSSETFVCETCDAVIDRDENASRIILARSRGEKVAPGWWETQNARGAAVSPSTFGSTAGCVDPRITRKRVA